MSQSNQAEVETYLTEELLSELCSVLTFPNEKTSPQVLELVPEAPLTAEVEEEEDEPTIVEVMKEEPSIAEPSNEVEAQQPILEVSKFRRFLFEPHYKTKFAIWLEQYFEEVRLRKIAYQEFRRIHYANSGFRQLQRLMQRIVARAKANLANDPYRDYCERTKHLEN